MDTNTTLISQKGRQQSRRHGTLTDYSDGVGVGGGEEYYSSARQEAWGLKKNKSERECVCGAEGGGGSGVGYRRSAEWDA